VVEVKRKTSTRGMVFDIQRFSLHDGPGIRTTVFLKGCPLRCKWCHNPEGLEKHPQIRLTINLCARCGECVSACEHGGHEITSDGRHLLQPENCVLCGKCVEACPVGALALVGKRMSAEQVLAVVRRDRHFYERSGGGMTLSGGEPMAQFAFTRALLEAAKAEGISTAMETAALGPRRSFEEIAPLVDLFLLDLKHTDDRQHRQLVGVSNRRILANIKYLVDSGWQTVIRVPWVPTENADEIFLAGLEEFLLSLSLQPPVEFMLYHRLGIGKWSSLGGHSTMPSEIRAAEREAVAPWIERLQAVGIPAKVG